MVNKKSSNNSEKEISKTAKEITKKMAQELNMPFVTERWLGGTFTNFPTISRRVEYLKDLE